MEKIEKFENCKIKNLQEIYGGNYIVETDYGPEHPEATDKNVFNDDGKLIRMVSNTHTWFHRDKHEWD